MVNLVIVSHSLKLAQGLVDIVKQMVTDSCKIVLAAGIDDNDNPIGTDAIKIMTAIEEASSPDGVIVFVDLGSAILSTRTAIELLPPETSKNVVISYAPLVEGVFAAAIAASAGENLSTVLCEANQSSALKLELADK